MRKILLPTICILLSAMLIAIIPTDAEAAIYEDTVRLHILAPSDSAEDQSLKLKIRDRVLEKYSSVLAASKSTEDAKRTVRLKEEEIAADCRTWILEEGFDYPVSANLTYEWYETREYSDFILPAGEYASLKIVIGEGEGQNWWCVMYPPLCLDAAVARTDTGYTDEEYKLISKSGYRVKFKLLEVVSSIADGLS